MAAASMRKLFTRARRTDTGDFVVCGSAPSALAENYRSRARRIRARRCISACLPDWRMCEVVGSETFSRETLPHSSSLIFPDPCADRYQRVPNDGGVLFVQVQGPGSHRRL